MISDESIEEQCPTAPRTATISNYATISTDENVIQDTLVANGPLSVLLDATQLQFYDSGIWDGHIPSVRFGCSKVTLNNKPMILLIVFSAGILGPRCVIGGIWGGRLDRILDCEEFVG